MPVQVFYKRVNYCKIPLFEIWYLFSWSLAKKLESNSYLHSELVDKESLRKKKGFCYTFIWGGGLRQIPIDRIQEFEQLSEFKYHWSAEWKKKCLMEYLLQKLSQLYLALWIDEMFGGLF